MLRTLNSILPAWEKILLAIGPRVKPNFSGSIILQRNTIVGEKDEARGHIQNYINTSLRS
jgi:hypothetical protein